MLPKTLKNLTVTSCFSAATLASPSRVDLDSSAAHTRFFVARDGRRLYGPLKRVNFAVARCDMVSYIRGHVPPILADPAADFRDLRDKWKRDSMPHSSAARMARLLSYRKIVDMGEAALPFLLGELKYDLDHWFIALHEITGADPVPAQDRGRLRAMADAWLNWGLANGISPRRV